MTLDTSLRSQWTHAAPDHSDLPWQLQLPDSWTQGRSIFGGLIAAAAAALHYRAQGEERAIRTINAHFLRPTTSGEVRAASLKMREGKHVTFSRATLAQTEGPAYIADIVSIHPRQTELIVPNTRTRPVCTPPEQLEDLPYIHGVTPEFTHHFHMRWAHGEYPYSGAKQASTIAHLRYRDLEASGIEGVLGLLDALPAPSLSLLTEFAAASSVSWTAHVLQIPSHFEQWFTFSYDTLFGADGFHTVVGYLYDERGELIAWTNQLAAVYG